MLKNYLKITWRNIQRNKLHSSINIVGLAVAFSISIILFLTAYFQFSYDSFHKDKDQLFKTSRFTNTDQGIRWSSQMPLPLGEALKTEIPDIETAVRVQMGTPENITYQDKNIEKVITRTDPDFFEVFNFPVTNGSKASILSGIQDIALSESTARAIFGEDDPIGKELNIGRMDEQRAFVVSAVIEDCPKNSSIQFDAVARIESRTGYDDDRNNWGSNTANIFIKISKKTNRHIVEDKLFALVEKYYPEQLAQLKTEHPGVLDPRELLSLSLTNIDDIHFSGERSSPLAIVYAIMGLGIFILLIACFNFVNLNMAQSFGRSRELGIRKTLGAFKGQLFMQLWGEAFLLYFFGFILGIMLAYKLLPLYSAQFDVRIEIATFFQPSFLAILTGVFFAVTLIAGGYPALKMANFRLVEILKGNVSTKKPGVLRNTLLVSQFTISGLLICISVIAGQQLDHLRDKPLGFRKEQVVSIPVGKQEDGRKVLARIRNEVSNDPNIISVTGAGVNLGRGRDRVTSRTTIGFDYNQNQISADWLLADFGYLETLQIPILKGRDFNPEYATDTANAVVVTERFVKLMGETNPVGKYFGGEDANTGNHIIGVIPDFNAYAPSGEPLPIALHLSSDEAINYVFVKVRSEDPLLAMEHITSVWERISPNAVFNGSFLDENIQAWYEGERAMTQIFGIASGIAIFLSCLGLFAMALLVIELRTKEIGIRKVMGASIKSIVSMISWQFLKLVLLGLFIAIPVAWFAMQTWIENYAYRIEINPLTFIWIALLIAAIALVTVSYHSIKAAIVNPVNSLRTE
ncbi:MAG TPA: FtsX-like permease family protein [Eudoraea sp.]|nr:FtsX-like permease family protein [Eudoraea sp.]